jgi:hypothetical protein
MSERTAASYLLANRTIIDNWVDGRRGRILSCDPDAGTVTVLWRRGAYNTLRMEPGRFSIVENEK